MYELVYEVEGRPQRYRLSGTEVFLGRSSENEVVLNDFSVSRRHAKIIKAGDEYHVLEEVGTVNGTFVNDQRIPTGVPVTLHNGDLVKIGLVSMKAVFD